MTIASLLGVMPSNLDRLNRIYGPSTWDVYSRLDESLNPTGPDLLYELAADYLRAGDVVLDAGCRDAAHLIRLVKAHGVTGVGIDPVPIHIEHASGAVAAAGLDAEITLHLGVIHELPYDEGHFDFVWCRDVLEQVDDLEGGLAELVRVTAPQARLLVYTTFATDRLDGADAAMMKRHLGNVESNLDMAYMEAAFQAAGLLIEVKQVIGPEWREYAEERTQPMSRALLRLSRLRRRQDEIVAESGREVYDHIEANLHWEVFQVLGKLVPVVYVLSRVRARP